MGKRYESTRPLEAIQIDHAKVDVIAVDEETGDALGRPWIALAFDTLTRMVTGFHLTMAPPTRLSTSLCLLHSVCDKTRWLKERGIRSDWPTAGLPDVVLTDSNTFFGPRAFVRACREEGIKNVWSVPREAKYGDHIETLIGTRLGAVPLLTDTVSADRRERDGRHARAVRLTLRELERWIGAEITGAYHHKRHSALRRSPIAAWRAHESEAVFRAPADCVTFRLSFLPEEECALHSDGVRLLGQTFWSRALSDDIDSDRKELTIRYDPRDLSRIFVKRPSGRFVKARNADAARVRAASRIEPKGGRASSSPILLNRDDELGELIADTTPGYLVHDLFVQDQAAFAMAFSGEGPERRDGPTFSPRMINGGSNPLAINGKPLNRLGQLRASRRSCANAVASATRACARKCLSSCPFAEGIDTPRRNDNARAPSFTRPVDPRA